MRTPIPNDPSRTGRSSRVRVLDFLHLVRWLDGSPILGHIEPYRQKILSDVLDTFDDEGRVQYNLALLGRGKKNAKSLDLCLAGLFACVANDSIHGNECLIVASDEGQAQDDLSLTKKLVAMSPHLLSRLVIYEKRIARKDGKGFIQILPGKDVLGQHGKSYKFLGIDEIHTQRDHALLEALALDPTRPDAQMWITSYASIFHKPGVPLYDLLAQGKAGLDPKMFFSWYGADYTTDPNFADLAPELRANPSIASFAEGYLDQQRRRLPSHVFRRLHLNLPGSPEGAAFSAEMIMDAITRGVRIRKPEPGIEYVGFIDMSGGSRADAVCAIGYKDHDGRAVLARVLDQGAPTPFDPRNAVERFATVLREYGIQWVVGDAFGGNQYVADFARHGIHYELCALSASKLYERLEPHLNAHQLVLVDDAKLESQFLGLTWRGGKIDSPSGELDDTSNAATGALLLALDPAPPIDTSMTDDEYAALRRLVMHPGEISGIDPADVAGSIFDRF